MITLRLPYPPTVNTYWRHKGNAIYVNPIGTTYRNNVFAIVASELGYHPKLKCRLGMAIELTMPDKRRRDIDNVFKAILDSLQYAGVYLNDSQIDDLRIRRLGVCPPGAADVVIQKLGLK